MRKLNIKISSDVRQKLASRHRVTEDEIEQCFASRLKKFLEDQRAEHATTPPTQWFVAETDMGRVLKVVFVFDGEVEIKTAYDANVEEIRIYNKFAQHT